MRYGFHAQWMRYEMYYYYTFEPVAVWWIFGGEMVAMYVQVILFRYC